MRLVLIGPPGAGKGTQAAILSRELGVPHISTGDLFRAHVRSETPLGREARPYLDTGELVPDHITSGMVRQRLSHPDACRGFLLDGFPRNLSQARELSAMLAAGDVALDAVVELSVPEDVVTARLMDRGRPDDTEEIIRHRHKVYQRQTAPLLDHYADVLVSIHAVGGVDAVSAKVMNSLRK